MLTKKTLIEFQDEPAFPCKESDVYKGLTKLEYFASLALSGCLANSQYRCVDQVDVEVYSVEKAKTLINEIYNATIATKEEYRRI